MYLDKFYNKYKTMNKLNAIEAVCIAYALYKKHKKQLIKNNKKRRFWVYPCYFINLFIHYFACTFEYIFQLLLYEHNVVRYFFRFKFIIER